MPSFIAENKATVLTVGMVALALIWMVSQGIAFAMQIGIVAGLFGILAVSLNLVMGYTGLLSVAQVGFYGLGAYVVAILTRDPPASIATSQTNPPIVAWSWLEALPLAMAISGLVALAMGIVFSRFRDDFFALATLGFAVIIHRLATSGRYFTRGALGLTYVPAPTLGPWTVDERWELLALILGCLAIAILISWYIVNTSFGRVLTAIREDEQAVEVYGYRATYFKLTIFVISGMMAGMGGALFAGYIQLVTPENFVLLQSIIVAAIVLIGGLASIWGSVLGAFAYVLMQDGLRFVPGFPLEYIGQARIGTLGILLAVLMLFRPQGLVGRYKL